MIKLSDAEAERLTCLIEECGEVIQAATKILRHGYHSCYPDSEISNREQLEKELGQLNLHIEKLIEEKDVIDDHIIFFKKQKKLDINQWLHYNRY